MLEINPASIDQVIRGRGGRLVTIDNDVCGIAKQLIEIDSRIRLRYNELGEYFMVVLEGAAAHGRDHLITTTTNIDNRLIERIRIISSPSYNTGAEIDKADARVDREIENSFVERVGEISERLSHAIKTDLKKGRPGPVYIPPDAY